ncbi:MAG TPA: ABC transporter ATP-binding protein [Chitinivibrionales bacterium]|nr:ABC transporter ATP-binding protein [Chitinivibrionales bacterium]
MTNPSSLHLISVSNLSHSFGGLKAVSNFNLTVNKDDIWGIIGPNGAGKTTVFNLLTGVYRPDSGNVIYNGENINGLPSHKIIGKGISRTFQNIRLFRSMSILDNVRCGSYCRLGYPLWSALFRSKTFSRMEGEQTARVKILLDEFGLADRMLETAASLPYGLQRKVELARALASGPGLLLLDEPGAGMNPSELDGLADLILRVKKQYGVAIILIEHRMQLVMRLCGRVKVLNFGETIFEGDPCGLAGNETVVKAYFGDDNGAFVN